MSIPWVHIFESTTSVYSWNIWKINIEHNSSETREKFFENVDITLVKRDWEKKESRFVSRSQMKPWLSRSPRSPPRGKRCRIIRNINKVGSSQKWDVWPVRCIHFGDLGWVLSFPLALSFPSLENLHACIIVVYGHILHIRARKNDPESDCKRAAYMQSNKHWCELCYISDISFCVAEEYVQ